MCVHVQDKSKVEGQLKQYEGQKALMQKTIEKQGVIENKKRESIMIVCGGRDKGAQRTSRLRAGGTGALWVQASVGVAD